MTPAATLVRSFREERGLSQKAAAYMLGSSQSFISSIETGVTSIPQNGFVEKLVREYKLKEVDERELNEAIRFSNRHFSLPIKSSANLVWITNAFFQQLDQLSEDQIDMISLVLKMNSPTYRGVSNPT